MNPPLRLRIRNALYSMTTTFVLKMAEYFAPGDTYHELFKTTKLCRAGIHHFYIPSCFRGVTSIHFEKVTNKECSLISPSTRSYFNNTPRSIGIWIIKTNIKNRIPLVISSFLKIRQFSFCEFTQISIISGYHLIVFINLLTNREKRLVSADNASEASMLSGNS